MTEIGDLLKDWLVERQTAGRFDSDKVLEDFDVFFEKFYGSLEKSAKRELCKEAFATARFRRRNISRWRKGFFALDLLVSVSREAGEAFQQEFLSHEEYAGDILLGVLMRIHARACRVTSEIVVLMKSGYADGSMSRWRSLYELGLAALAIKQIGRDAALDYYISGKVKDLEGMQEFQKCAEHMKYEPYTEEEIQQVSGAVRKLLNSVGRREEDYNGDFGWLRPHIGSGKRAKVEEFWDCLTGVMITNGQVRTFIPAIGI